VIDAIKPGIKWTDMHLLAERITLSELQKLGLVKEGFDIEKLIEQRAGFIF
jgi:Xaa-Pro dipeptidase